MAYGDRDGARSAERTRLHLRFGVRRARSDRVPRCAFDGDKRARSKAATGPRSRDRRVRSACHDDRRPRLANAAGGLTDHGLQRLREAQITHHATVRELLIDRLDDRDIKKPATSGRKPCPARSQALSGHCSQPRCPTSPPPDAPAPETNRHLCAVVPPVRAPQGRAVWSRDARSESGSGLACVAPGRLQPPSPG